ncbi:HNH endonuclease [Flexivirga alba]|uniref:HNH endonuclease n=1 Tax=Flexivirga alba TaxID=702742 RepID=A0ABW2ACF3_9MICO
MDDTRTDTIERAECAFNASAVRAFHDRLDEAITADTLEDLLTEARALEEAKNAITARQARITVQAHHQQRQRDLPRGINRATTARKVGSDIALARRSAPHLGSRLLGLAHAVVEEMPCTFAALAAGVITERDATDLVAATAYLTREDRGRVDTAIAGDLGTVSHRRLIAAAHAAAYQADPAAATARRAHAESERRVSLRPAPDCMTWLTALLPVKDGVACFAALKAQADATATTEHPRGQVMADTLVERVTGRTPADGTGVNINLILPLDALTGDTRAEVPGYGPIPADLAREWITDHPDKAARIRRLFAYPGTGDLIGMESASRCYTGLLADFIRLRDRTCRTPYCDAPIAHTDHITSHAKGGATSERNGQGLCERCNYDKEHPDHLVGGDAGETYTLTGGLTASSRPPAPPGHPPPTRSPISRTLMNIEFSQCGAVPPTAVQCQ